jgi:hypothetical protein
MSNRSTRSAAGSRFDRNDYGLSTEPLHRLVDTSQLMTAFPPVRSELPELPILRISLCPLRPPLCALLVYTPAFPLYAGLSSPRLSLSMTAFSLHSLSSLHALTGSLPLAAT